MPDTVSEARSAMHPDAQESTKNAVYHAGVLLNVRARTPTHPQVGDGACWLLKIVETRAHLVERLQQSVSPSWLDLSL